MKLLEIKKLIKTYSDPKKAFTFQNFFKKNSNDQFLGVTTSILRNLSKELYHIPLSDVQKLMASQIIDERSLANYILVLKFQKGTEVEQKKVFNFYIKNKNLIHDWSNVDNSAPYIVGEYLLNKNKDLLYKLIKSKRIWDRRIAIVSTYHFIKNNHLDDTLKLAQLSLNDSEDLIHKAVGWMLRELGKKDVIRLENFLDKYSHIMPRTMLRYSIEKFSESKRLKYLKSKLTKNL